MPPPAGLDAQAANDKRRMTLTALEQACEQAAPKDAPLKCESVVLYQGGQYFLYKYRRYNDVRLVFAPESDIAAFGGDPDNFQYPRWNLDFSLLRAYQDGRPASTPDYLKIDWKGPQAGEPVFVAGHPGSTDRLLTVAQLQREAKYIHFWLLRYAELRGRLIQFSKESPAHASMAADQLNSLENSIKVRRKQLDALLDDRLMSRKRTEEAALRARAGKLPPAGSLAAGGAGGPARTGAVLSLRVHRAGRGIQQPALPVCDRAGARRRGADQTQPRTPARIHRCRPAAAEATDRGARARPQRTGRADLQFRPGAHARVPGAGLSAGAEPVQGGFAGLTGPGAGPEHEARRPGRAQGAVGRR